MTRTMYDAVTPGNIPLTGSTLIAGYLDGKFANLPALRTRFPHETIVEIAVFSSTPAAKGRVLDRENGDATAAEAVQWCLAYPGSNTDLTVYCNSSDWPAAKQAFVSAGVTQPNWWVADYDNNATIPSGAIAKQYATGNFDKSVVADYWPGVDPAPVAKPVTPAPSSGSTPVSTATSAHVKTIAEAEVGYHEGQNSSGWDNIQKYSEQLPGFAWSDGQPWCDTFANWVYWKAGVPVPEASASCAESVAAYQKAGRWTEYPGNGFQALYGAGTGGDHTGIVMSYDGTDIHTVEGNTNTTGSAQGDGVYQQTRVRTDAYVYGYGVPYLDEYLVSADPAWNGKWGGKGAAPAKPVTPAPAPKPAPKPAPAPALPLVSVTHLNAAAKADIPAATGHKSKYVSEVLILEKALNHLGLLNKSYVDGSFGTLTKTAYRDWQIKCGYTGPDADGYPGVASLQQLAKKMPAGLQFKAGS